MARHNFWNRDPARTDSVLASAVSQRPAAFHTHCMWAYAFRTWFPNCAFLQAHFRKTCTTQASSWSAHVPVPPARQDRTATHLPISDVGQCTRPVCIGGDGGAIMFRVL
eukprot:11728130-Alexandrium_andersonii.AAC.1